MGTVNTTAVTSPTSSTTGTLKRSVADTIRHLTPGYAIQMLTTSGRVGPDNIVREKGMIGKRRVDAPKYEAFTRTPLAVEFNVSSVTSTVVYVLTSASGLRPKMTLVNASSPDQVARISVVSSATITIVSVGDETFAPVAGDKLLAMGPAYGENSSSPYILSKEPDNLYNLTQIMRFTVGISRSAKGNPHYGGARWAAYKEENMWEGMRKAELSMLFSERPSSTNETTTDSTLSDTFRTMRGLWNWAQGSHDAGGAWTHENFITDLPADMDDTVSLMMKKVMLCGQQTYSTMLNWATDKLVIQQSGSEKYKTLGVMPTKFIGAKGEIDVIVHDAFNHGALANSALVIVPELIDYVYLRDNDFKVKEGIQNNDVDGVQDEVLGEVSICPRDAGYSMTKITNIAA